MAADVLVLGENGQVAVTWQRLVLVWLEEGHLGTTASQRDLQARLRQVCLDELEAMIDEKWQPNHCQTSLLMRSWVLEGRASGVSSY